MDNLVDMVGLRPILQSAGIIYGGDNFEVLYSKLLGDAQHASCAQEIERAVFEYFAAMRLPDEPTLYDHLILSLREKDVIATFNWDPFLVPAYGRNRHRASLPTVLFLHGNTAVGYCMNHKPATTGDRGRICKRCGAAFTDSRLLFPVAHKNYSADPFTEKSWDILRTSLQTAYVLTIFGYGAPSSDTEAVALMNAAWGNPVDRELEQVEIIDIKSEDSLQQTWAPFIHSHHYQTCRTFYDSWTAKHPRRTCEGMWNQLMEVEFIDDNCLPTKAGWAGLDAWLKPIIEDEGTR